MRLFLVECPIESCYVCRGFPLNFLAKKAPGGGRGDEMIRSYLPGSQHKQAKDNFNKITGERGKEATYN